MIERRREEIRLIEAEYGEVEVGPNLDWLIIKRWPLPSGWNKGESAVLIFIPPGYPVTPPDNFYTDNDLRSVGSTQPPGNTSPDQSQVGRSWLQFSYHVEAGDWQPHADVLQGHNLLTFLVGVRRRLSEVS